MAIEEFVPISELLKEDIAPTGGLVLDTAKTILFMEYLKMLESHFVKTATAHEEILKIMHELRLK